MKNCRAGVWAGTSAVMHVLWPLLGDASSHSGGSRLVDASTTRVQLALRFDAAHAMNIDGWQVRVGRYRIPMRVERDGNDTVLIMGLHYRAVVPWAGLHPGIGAHGPVVLTLLPPAAKRGLRMTLHEWQPHGQSCDSLPDTFDEARRRIRERFIVEEIVAGDIPDAVLPPVEALSEYCFDLRRIGQVTR